MQKIIEFKESFWLFIANHLPRLRTVDRYRTSVLRLAGVKIDKNACAWSGLDIRPIGFAKNLVVGYGTFINVNLRCAVPRDGQVKIGKNCAIGPNVSFECFNHNTIWTPKEKWGGKASPITIENRVWIGAHSVILGGVTVGTGAVVAAGAVVTKDVKPNTLVGGVPAKKIKELSSE